MECGLILDGFADFQEDDEIECLKVTWKAPDNVILPGDSGTVRVEAKNSGASSGGAGGAGGAVNNNSVNSTSSARGASNSNASAADVQSTGKRMHAGRS